MSLAQVIQQAFAIGRTFKLLGSVHMALFCVMMIFALWCVTEVLHTATWARIGMHSRWVSSADFGGVFAGCPILAGWTQTDELALGTLHSHQPWPFGARTVAGTD